MNAMAAVARLLDVGAKRPWCAELIAEPTHRRASSVTLAPAVILTPAVILAPERRYARCPHCGQRTR